MEDPGYRKRLALVAAATAVLASAALAAGAQTERFPQGHKPTQSQPMTRVEDDAERRAVPGSRDVVDELTPRLFVRRAVENGRAGLQQSQLALQRASRPAVRDFALQLIADHGRSNQELERIAQRKNIPLPAGVDVEHQATLETLQAMTGEAFDVAYLGAIKNAQQRSIAMFETALEPGFEDAELEAFARRTLPVRRGHAVRLAQVEAGAP